MKLADLAMSLNLKLEAGEVGLDKEVTGGYVGDLLSQVMARAQQGNLWVTVQAHPNVVAVAVVAGLCGIVVAEGVAVDPATLAKANEEAIPLLSTARSSYDVVAAMVHSGVSGAG